MHHSHYWQSILGAPNSAKWPHLEFVRKEVVEMLKQGLIEVGSGPWVAPAFAVPWLRSKKLRLVVDYKGTNS